MIEQLRKKVQNHQMISREEALLLSTCDLEQLCAAANQIRISFCGDGFDLCTIVNGKSGRCTEDCKYCAQSVHYPVDVEEYPLLDNQTLEQGAYRNAALGILRYSVVTSGRFLCDEELDRLCESYRRIQQTGAISLCASHGLLRYDQFVRLAGAGVTRYHNNLETSHSNFSNICTTHSFEDKIEAIQNAQRAGLTVCSGGIMGLGETMEDRIDMALTLRDLGIRSIPINILTPIAGTPFEHLPPLSTEEVCRIVAIYRFLLPEAALRLAGGRGRLADKGRSAFLSGANAAISGEMLTTSGIRIEEDLAMIHALGFQVKHL